MKEALKLLLRVYYQPPMMMVTYSITQKLSESLSLSLFRITSPTFSVRARRSLTELSSDEFSDGLQTDL